MGTRGSFRGGKVAGA